jgi:hypothetical protein
MKKVITIVFLIVAGLAKGGGPEDSVLLSGPPTRPWFSPDYIPLQYAGNIGWLSAGIGYRARKDNYQISLVYGYAPPSVSGLHIHMITAKNIIHLYKLRLREKDTLIPYGAVGVNLEIGGESFFMLPSNMPEKYYHFPKSLHCIPATGVKWRRQSNRLKGFSGIEFFVELSTVDVLVFYKATSENISLQQILSTSFGLHLLRI